MPFVYNSKKTFKMCFGDLKSLDRVISLQLTKCGLRLIKRVSMTFVDGGGENTKTYTTPDIFN